MVPLAQRYLVHAAQPVAVVTLTPLVARVYLLQLGKEREVWSLGVRWMALALALQQSPAVPAMYSRVVLRADGPGCHGFLQELNT